MFLEFKTTNNEPILINMNHISYVRALSSETTEISTIGSGVKLYIKMSYPEFIEITGFNNKSSSEKSTTYAMY